MSVLISAGALHNISAGALHNISAGATPNISAGASHNMSAGTMPNVASDAMDNVANVPPIPARPTLPTVLDVRWRLGGPSGRIDYDAGHLPGARFIDLDDDLSGPPGAGGRHPLPDPQRLQEVLRAAGVRSSGAVIVYDGGDGLAGARAWWVLRWAGCHDVRVLDGGFPAWVAAGYSIEQDPPAQVEPGDVTVVPGGMPVLTADEAAGFGEHGVLIDARQAPRYRGEVEPIDPIAGHIPGAVNLPYADLVEADGRLRAADILRSRFVEVGVDPSGGTPTAAYCGSGVTAAHTVLAMTEAGLAMPSLYVGSWSDWITDPHRPIATGARP